MSDRLSLAKDKIRVLLLEGISDSAVARPARRGLHERDPASEGALRRGLRAALEGVHLLGIRSRTQLTEACSRPRTGWSAVGCFSVGTNQVDLDAARRARACRFQRAVLQHPQRRRTGDRRNRHAAAPASSRARSARIAGGWDKSAAGSHEVRGKTLGIVGYGNIGTQLSKLAEAMGMRVIFYDHTDKLRTATRSRPEPRGTAGAERCREPARPRDAGDARDDRAPPRSAR